MATPDPNELQVIDAYAAAERQKIETWYSAEMEKLKARLNERMQYLTDADKLAWAQFQQRANETWSTTSGFDSGSTYDYGTGISHGSGWRSETTRTYVVGNPARDYAAIQAKLKNSRQATQADFERAQKWLTWQRQERLAGVQAEADRRKAAIALRDRRAQAESGRALSGDPTPKVEAVMGGAGGQYQALIGDGLVPEGGVVQGFRVRAVRPNSVVFEKDGQTWVQQIE